ncbi:MAG: rRNA maturation RNase YbeY [Phycisphaerales bacterium]|nr:rRNA maturation RNase YbeY [Phycisphaerales bacterium]
MPVLMNTTDQTSEGDTAGSDPSEPSEPPQPPEPACSGGDRVLEIIDRTRRLEGDELELLRDGLERLIERLEGRCVRLTVEVVDDARMCLLHQRWHDDPSTTDVLTFPMSEPGEPIDVDVACCLDEAERRALGLGHERVRELILYALHGLLHVAGFDDHDEESFRAMHAEEDRLLESVGLGAIFAPRSGPAREGDS